MAAGPAAAAVASPAQPQQPAAASHPPLLLMGTDAGELLALDASRGGLVARLSLGAKVTGLCTLPLPPSLDRQQPSQPLLLVATQAGAMCLVDLQGFLERAPGGRERSGSGGGSQGGSAPGAVSKHWQREAAASLDACLLDVVQLPGEAFSVPAAVGHGGVAVGCRDNHLYCLAAASDGAST